MRSMVVEAFQSAALMVHNVQLARPLHRPSGGPPPRTGED